MTGHLLLVLVLCLLASFPASLRGEQCKPDPINPCIANCNGTTFDISYIFDFPIRDKVRTDLVWSPCLGLKCYNTGVLDKDCAVCETEEFSSYNMSCGKKSNSIWIWSPEIGTKSQSSGVSLPNWQVEYAFGDYWRISIFEFVVDETLEEPEFTFVGMDPMLQFNFHVRGKCIGQPTQECQKYYDKIKQRSANKND